MNLARLGPILLLALIGCGGPEFQYNGAWRGNRNLQLPNVDRYTAYTAGDVTLTIKDNKFDLTEAGIPTSGDVAYSGSHIELHTKYIMNVSIAHEGADADQNHPTIVVVPQKDGTLLFEDPRAPDGKPVALKRQETKAN
ncbi:MAG TPA: hypothetical protein VG820_10690 [Fimbriimonadaceae bacterium]|nr:hypothetical protein [Fimbriimonadaceae bacterium]